MADKKISQLTALVTPALADLVAIVDTVAGVTKKITLTNLKAALDPTPTVGVFMPNDLQNRGGLTSSGFSNNTTAVFAAFKIPFKIVINKLTFITDNVTTPSTLDIAVYSEDGQTKMFEVTTANLVAADTFYTTAVDSVTLLPGIYYFGEVANVSPVSLTLWRYLGATQLPTSHPAGEPVLGGTKVVAAGTLPATIDPTTITPAESKLLLARFDT